MTRAPMLRRILLGTSLLLLAAACATTPAPPDESLLAQAGFKTLAASTQAQKEHLQSLPPGQLTAYQQTGRHFYVYPDVSNNKLYVGTPKEYQAYLALRTKNGLPNPQPADATTADMKSYLRQDAAMLQANAYANQAPSWEVWPDFSTLGWTP